MKKKNQFKKDVRIRVKKKLRKLKGCELGAFLFFDIAKI